MRRLAFEPCSYSRENTEVASDSSIPLIRIKNGRTRKVFYCETIGPRRCTGWNNTSQGLFEKSPMSMLEKNHLSFRAPNSFSSPPFYNHFFCLLTIYRAS
ncbi:hypothetical protein TNIN_435581 [Trichonephila inaurata madagascariensis]|uniref:Uncharacterized protein n=1 Tax=Trichonephila inaurata madagascariensis TaxID=2747483 RepID=A0A8X6Y1M5_9ARAC|nr:hypothetical protein TNIN_435581 [Trichonephila inaurata madagascariensis]